MIESPEDYELFHAGVKGMKWGVRKEAKKDAREHARADMFYGEGAGTRRKLIRAKVNAKSEKDPQYKEAFDHYRSQQDMATHASKARHERARKDVTSKTVKTAKGVHRQLTGGFGTVSMASAAIAGGYVYSRSKGYDKVVKRKAKAAWNSPVVKDSIQAGKDFFKR